MIRLRLGEPGRALRILCLGAHSDDIEIGCGGSILRLLQDYAASEVRWVVFSGDEARADEARASATEFLAGTSRFEIVLHEFRDGYFPAQYAEVKQAIEAARAGFEPDLIFTHYRHDGHQDHRTISDLTYTAFRRHFILEYEIPKYDGDTGAPNLFVPLGPEIRGRKIDGLMRHFGTQGHRSWFTPETFDGLMRLRGVQSGADDGYAEGFYCRRALL
jgi:LmbE family N-acetylglucosaminyl deacetylase